MSKNKILSVAMIVKNEEHNVKSFLKSFLSFADELVITDTGSTDNTIPCIQSYGDKRIRLIQRQWDNDFSAARNNSIINCSGKWIAHLDADDYVSVKMGKHIRKIANLCPENLIIAFLIKSLMIKYLGKDMWGAAWGARMHPNHPNLKFHYRIHENIYNIEPEKIYKYIKSEVVVVHKGYKEDVDGEKLKRNLPMLEKEIRERPEAYALTYTYANNLAMLGQDEKAICYYNKVIENPMVKEKNLDLYAQTFVCIGDCLRKIGHTTKNFGFIKEAIKWCAKSVTLREPNIPAYYVLLRCYIDLGEYNFAIQCCDYVLNTPDYDSQVLLSNQQLKRECELKREDLYQFKQKKERENG